MAELATIARPYAEALYKATPPNEAVALVEPLDALAAVAASPQLRQFADDPKVTSAQVFELVSAVTKSPLDQRTRNLLQAAIDNGRVAALPEIARQFRALVNARSGVSDAVVYSAFPLDDDQLAALVATLERRFGRKLKATVEVDPALIGGIRIVVGDAVLDTSVAARLQQMKVALTQ
jgi:F-type H+-transporting ATPase subunit delta